MSTVTYDWDSVVVGDPASPMDLAAEPTVSCGHRFEAPGLALPVMEWRCTRPPHTAGQHVAEGLTDVKAVAPMDGAS